MSKLLEERQVRIDATLEQIDKKLSNVDVAIRDLNARIDDLNIRIDNLNISLSAKIDDIEAQQECSFININKQKKLVVITYENAMQIAKTAMQLCNDGVLNKSDCSKFGELYNLFLDANVAYAQLLNEYRRHPDSLYLIRVNTARVRMNDNLTNLIRKAEELGIEWKKTLDDNLPDKNDTNFIWRIARWVTTRLIFIAKIFTILSKGQCHPCLFTILLKGQRPPCLKSSSP